MSIYKKFCSEVLGEDGSLKEFSLNYPENFNFAYDVVDAIAEETPDKTAIVWCNTEGEEHVFTFADLREQSIRIANVFQRAGLKKGMRVMLVLKRHYEYWFTILALHRLGIVAIPATHMLLVSDYVYRIQMAKIDAVICTPNNDVPNKLRSAVQQSGSNCILWCIKKDITDFRNLTEEAKKADTKLERVQTLATDPMLMYFTSGTTGYPKGVFHDFTYPLAHIITAKYWQQVSEGGLHLTVSETGWGKASWGKIYGQWLCGAAVMVYDFDNFDPRQMCHIINKYGVDSFCAPPTVYRYIVRKGLPGLPGLKYAATAGEMLAPEVFKKFQESTGLKLNEGYGQTETVLLLANFKGMEVVEGALGKPSPFYNVQLRSKDGEEVPQGEIGEICVVPKDGARQPGIFSGYLDDDAQYEYVWRDGVFHTGDSAYIDENGYFWFYGRFDDIIKTGGFRVGPYEIENVIMEHPAVVECSVVGIPDELRGQAIKAFIVLGNGYEKSKALEFDIKDFCNEKLAEYKWIRQIEFVDDLPKTISGKIRKTELRER